MRPRQSSASSWCWLAQFSSRSLWLRNATLSHTQRRESRRAAIFQETSCGSSDSSSTAAQMRSKLWRMEGVADGPGAPAETAPPVPAAVALPEVAEVGGPVPLREHLGVIWNAVLPEQIVTLTKSRLGLATLTHGARASTVAETASAAPPVEGSSFTCGRWDPHHAHSLGVGCGGSIVSLDTRTMKSAVRACPSPKLASWSRDRSPSYRSTCA